MSGERNFLLLRDHWLGLEPKTYCLHLDLQEVSSLMVLVDLEEETEVYEVIRDPATALADSLGLLKSQYVVPR